MSNKHDELRKNGWSWPGGGCATPDDSYDLVLQLDAHLSVAETKNVSIIGGSGHQCYDAVRNGRPPKILLTYVEPLADDSQVVNVLAEYPMYANDVSSQGSMNAGTVILQDRVYGVVIYVSGMTVNYLSVARYTSDV